MPLFGRKKEPKKEIEEIKEVIEKPKLPKFPEIEEKPPEIKAPEPEKPAFAPLFVKLDRYKKILDSIAELKSILEAVRNAFDALNELERLRSETVKSIQSTIEKVNKKMVSLDSEFIRPSGYEKGVSEEIPIEAPESLKGTISDLRSQIERLKSELQDIG
jgi:chromosome segregation ATPase